MPTLKPKGYDLLQKFQNTRNEYNFAKNAYMRKKAEHIEACKKILNSSEVTREHKNEIEKTLKNLKGTVNWWI